MADRFHSIHGELSTLDSADAGRELQHAVDEVLSEVDLRGDALGETLPRLEVLYGDAVYSELFRVLCHLRLDPAEAKRLWGEVLVHRDMMRERLCAPLDLRVAMLSYLVEVQHAIENPTIIERAEFERTQESAYTDHLTGLRNFRYFAEQLNHEVLRSDQYSEPLSLVMLDIDHFKTFNDRNGHDAGNDVLRRVGGIIRETLRKVDVGARYGGEEFAVILPSTPKRGARAAAERLREAIRAHDFPNGTHQPLGRVTASLGIATYPADGRNATEFVKHCDRALYVAKAEGRDRVGMLGGLRSYPRIKIELNGLCRVAGDERPLRTIQVGTGGMSFRTTAELELGVLVEAELILTGRVTLLPVSGRVLRVSPLHKGWADIALHFVDMGAAERRVLTGFVRNRSAA